jgi:phosphate starvation-inducible protein PhoH
MAERLVPVEDADEQRLLFGSMDRNVRAIRERWHVFVSARRGTLRVVGDDEGSVREVTRRISGALARVRDGDDPPTDGEMYSMLVEDPHEDGVDREAERDRDDGRQRRGPGSARSPRDNTHGQHSAHGSGGHGGHGKSRIAPAAHSMPEVRPLSPRQAEYIEAIRSQDVVFGIGPAGTGKTYLAVAEAVASLRAGTHKKLILTRPAVEAGEKLGYLPGDFQAKINPYLRPLYDALEEMLRFGELQRSIQHDVIEILPLAYMRGRTLKHAFIILDEAQNTTPAQMKMFLTRMGEGSKIVVTGDVTQVDLPDDQTSGLVDAARVLRGVQGLGLVEFSGADIIRHPMVQRIVDAYGRDDAARQPPDTGHGPMAPPPP